MMSRKKDNEPLKRGVLAKALKKPNAAIPVRQKLSKSKSKKVSVEQAPSTLAEKPSYAEVKTCVQKEEVEKLSEIIRLEEAPSQPRAGRLEYGINPFLDEIHGPTIEEVEVGLAMAQKREDSRKGVGYIDPRSHLLSDRQTYANAVAERLLARIKEEEDSRKGGGYIDTRSHLLSDRQKYANAAAEKLRAIIKEEEDSQTGDLYIGPSPQLLSD